MARTTKPLSHTEVKQAKVRDKEYSLADGKNLYLRVKPTGSKQWIFNYYRPGTNKRANLGLGIFPDVSLLAARKKADELRRLLANGIDPKDHKEEVKRSDLEKNVNTFENIARKWLELKKNSVSIGYHATITDRLEKFIFPKMGSTPVHKINAARTIEIISPLAKSDKLETVKKVCRWVNEVMVHAVNTGIIHTNPLAGIGKAFNAPKVQHMPALKPEELPELMYKIQHSNTKVVTRCLIEWQLHTMVRPGEAAGSRWDEVDETKLTWTIPAERMKKGNPHIIPLTEQSLKLLAILKPISGNREYVFPSDHDPRQPANSQSANRALGRMGFKGRLVSHGLRALASTALNEQGFASDLIEAALAHADKNSIRAIYNRAQYIERRRTMMQWWSDQIERSAAGLPIKGPQQQEPYALSNYAP